MTDQIHVSKILEIPNLNDGTGRELHQLHDTAQQHLRALKALGHEPDGSFITSMLELKLDAHTMFEWQHHSQRICANTLLMTCSVQVSAPDGSTVTA